MKKLLAVVFLTLFSAALGFASAADFNKVDADNDGRISKKEYLDAGAKAFDKLDKNKDGVLSGNELKKSNKLDAAKFIQEEDSNKDGKISREEFTKAAEKRFKYLDKDGDAYITQKEWNDVKDGVNPKNTKTMPVSPLMIFTF